MATKVNVIFYSTYGHMYQMAQAALEGVNSVDGVEGQLLRIAENVPQEVLEAMGAVEAQKAFAHVPLAGNDDLVAAQGFVFALPTRFGNMPSQAKSFFDATGPLWATGALVDKVAGVMTSSATQHSGQESTILATQIVLQHHGMVIAGLPQNTPELGETSKVQGGSYYGATTIAGADGSRMPSTEELALARLQGQRIARLTQKLHG